MKITKDNVSIEFSASEYKSLQNIVDSILENELSISLYKRMQDVEPIKLQPATILPQYQSNTVPLNSWSTSVPEPLVEEDECKIPNVMDDIAKKYPKSVIDEHVNQTNGELVDPSKINVKYKNNNNECSDFRCPNCHQAKLAYVENVDGEFVYLLREIVGNEARLYFLDTKRIDELLVLNGFNTFNCNGVADTDFVEVIMEALKVDNSFITEEAILSYKEDGDFNLVCPICCTLNNVGRWHKDAMYGCGLDYSPCDYCGSEKVIDINSGEYKCDNDKCYTNKEDE